MASRASMECVRSYWPRRRSSEARQTRLQALDALAPSLPCVPMMRAFAGLSEACQCCPPHSAATPAPFRLRLRIAHPPMSAERPICLKRRVFQHVLAGRSQDGDKPRFVRGVLPCAPPHLSTVARAMSVISLANLHVFSLAQSSGLIPASSCPMRRSKRHLVAVDSWALRHPGTGSAWAPQREVTVCQVRCVMLL